MSNGTTEHQYDLYKLEYEKAAERYENIYQAIWQNFSYMAALSAGILAFASDKLPFALTSAIALVPLVFWFFATFLPMNSYGEQARTRLSRIEKNLNGTFLKGLTAEEQLQHFQDFRTKTFPWRVRDAVWVFGVLVTLAWLLSVAAAIRAGTVTRPPADPQKIQVVSPVEIRSDTSHRGAPR